MVAPPISTGRKKTLPNEGMLSISAAEAGKISQVFSHLLFCFENGLRTTVQGFSW